MSYFAVTDFKFGMDRRRERVAGVPGTLWLGKNIHISRGGDIQRSKMFVPEYDLPEGTFGCAQVRGQLFVFGSIPQPVGIPATIQYQRLEAANPSAAMTEVLDIETFDGAFYVIARYDDGRLHHFYDGARVTDWDAVGDTNSDAPTMASYLADIIDDDAAVSARATGTTITVTARVAGTPFTIEQNTTDDGGTSDQDIVLATTQANVPAVAEVQASSVLTITQGTHGNISGITVDGDELMQHAVAYATSHTATAAAIAVQINNRNAVHGYTAVANVATITITAAIGTGAEPNEFAVVANTTGDVLFSTPSMAGGVDEVEPVAQVATATIVGTFEPADVYTIIINETEFSSNGRSAATGTSAFLHKKRIWSPANSLFNYCKLLDPTDFTDPATSSGAGFLNMASETEGQERLIGAAPYGTQAAFFSRNTIHVWDISADAEENTIQNTLANTGALAARAILPYGNLDVYYLDEPGFRSLKSHGQTGEAFASDIGNPMDSFVREHLDTLTEPQIRRAVSTIGPEGRFWCAVGGYIFVLSNFPGSKITAWSYYDPGFEVSDFVRVRNKVYARSGDTIYLYGGTDGETYPDDDEMIAEVSTPFMTAQTPGTVKQLKGFDIGCTGEWDGYVLVNPNDEVQAISIGKVTKTTYNDPHGNIAIPGVTSHMALRFVCSKAGPATISNLVVHYDPVEAK